MCVYASVCMFIQLLHYEMDETKGQFFNSSCCVFFFSETSSLSKGEEHSLSCYLLFTIYLDGKR